ncbi:hypothetical protein Tco_0761965 [Tanacetum coccineum]
MEEELPHPGFHIRAVNPINPRCLKNEVEKHLDAGLIYPIRIVLESKPRLQSVAPDWNEPLEHMCDAQAICLREEMLAVVYAFEEKFRSYPCHEQMHCVLRIIPPQVISLQESILGEIAPMGSAPS